MRAYPEVQLAPDQYDKLATEVTFNGKKIYFHVLKWKYGWQK